MRTVTKLKVTRKYPLVLLVIVVSRKAKRWEVEKVK
jgi:hypothetical protein